MDYPIKLMDNHAMAATTQTIHQLMENSLKVAFLKAGCAQFKDGTLTDLRNLPFAALAQACAGSYEIQPFSKPSSQTGTGGAFLVTANVPHQIIHHSKSK